MAKDCLSNFWQKTAEYPIVTIGLSALVGYGMSTYFQNEKKNTLPDTASNTKIGLASLLYNGASLGNGLHNKPLGFHNIGNTCYMNAALTALFCTEASKSLADWRPVEKGKEISILNAFKAPAENYKKISIFNAFKKLAESYHAPNATQETIDAHAKEFYNTFQPIWFGKDRYNAQEDAQELLNHLLDLQGEEYPFSKIEEVTFTACEDCIQQLKKEEKPKKASHVMLDLTIKENAPDDTKKALANLAEEESMTLDDAKCKKCKETGKNHTTILQPAKETNVTPVMLKRFSSDDHGNTIKNFHVIPIPLTTPAGSLKSFIVHCGYTAYNGHYVSYGKRNGTWYHFDDNDVKKVNEQDMQNILKYNKGEKGQPYILFYEKPTQRPSALGPITQRSSMPRRNVYQDIPSFLGKNKYANPNPPKQYLGYLAFPESDMCLKMQSTDLQQQKINSFSKDHNDLD